MYLFLFQLRNEDDSRLRSFGCGVRCGARAVRQRPHPGAPRTQPMRPENHPREETRR